MVQRIVAFLRGLIGGRGGTDSTSGSKSSGKYGRK